MIVVRNIARCFLLMGPALALAACGSNRQEELEKQLARARAEAQEATAAREAAERDLAAARAKTNDTALSDFYGGSPDAMDQESPVDDIPDAGPADGGDMPPPDPGAPAADLQAAGA